MNQRNSSSVTYLAAALLPWSYSFAQAPLTPPKDVRVTNVEVRDKPVSGIGMGGLLVVLERTTLPAIAREVMGSPSTTGAGDAQSQWLCFTLDEVPTVQRVWIVSDRALGGRDERVTGIYAAQIRETEKPTEACPALPAAFKPVIFDNRLRLGASLEALQGVLGEPPKGPDGWWRYSYAGTILLIRAGQPVEYKVSSSLEIELRGGKVTAILARQATTS